MIFSAFIFVFTDFIYIFATEILNLSSYQFIEVFQKRLDVLNFSMCTICRYRANLNRYKRY